MLKDQTPDDWKPCVVLGCRRTGKVREAGRRFVCAPHVGKCGENLIKDHTRRASDLIDKQRRHDLKPRRDNHALVAASLAEGMAWNLIVAKAGQLFGFKPEFSPERAGE
jgi:hypothetical protein